MFRWSAAGALALHALVLVLGSGLDPDALRAGGDAKPHLRLVQLMAEEPALRNVYPPAYHAVGALLAPGLGLATFAKLFAFASAAALLAGFRCFQHAAGLPEASAALFAWSPYLFALSWCLPKIETAGYALALTAFGLILRERRIAVAAVVLATAWVHTGAFLFLGLGGGALALARRDVRGLAALAVGGLAAAPLPAIHMADGCSLAQAFLFSPGDYLRDAARAGNLESWDRIAVLASPIAIALAARGATALWRLDRSVSLLCLFCVVLYANELWLAPFGARTTLDLLRGLTVLAIPLASAGGLAIAGSGRAAIAAIAACAVWAVASLALVVPESCHTAPIDLDAIGSLDVDRCTFRWRAGIAKTGTFLQVPGSSASSSSAGPGTEPGT